MTFTIHKGKHRPKSWWTRLRLWYNHRSIHHRVTFFSSCKYDLKSDDNQDVNKLFGIGYFWNKKHSARFGWNYAFIPDRINIYAYCHISGVVKWEYICSVALNDEYLFMLNINQKSYNFLVIDYDSGSAIVERTIAKGHTKKLGYALGLYFGGNQTAPHDMSVQIK